MSTILPAERWYHIGPHGYFDLIRLARSGRTTLMRVLYILALFAALAVVYYNETRSAHVFASTKKIGPAFTNRSESINRNARIAERFSITILVAQNVAVFLLMPLNMATAIQEERDTHTLMLLFTTQLTAWQIVLGKLVSRIAQVGSILLAGLPILSFVQLWGGIDMPMIAANFWNTAMLLLLVGMLSLSIAIANHGVFRAAGLSYLIIWGTLTLSTCCGVSMEKNPVLLTPRSSGPGGYEEMLAFAAVLSVIYAAVSAFLAVKAAQNLDRQRTAEPTSHDDGPLANSERKHPRDRHRPPIADDVIAWKERYFDPSIWMVGPLAFMPFVLVVVWIHLIAISGVGFDAQETGAIWEHFRNFYFFTMLGSAAIFILAVSFRLAGCIVRERQQQTLEPLLVLPFTQREFLIAKVRGNLLRCRAWLLPFAVSWLIVTSGPTANGFLLLLAMTIHLAFFASLGLFLSVYCRTAAAAYMSLGITVFLLVVGTTLARLVLRDSGLALFAVL